MKIRKKLIEVALPLDAINTESLRRKQKAPKGWPTSFHKWWAQRPLAAARAVIFSQMVDDPSEYTDTLKMDGKLLRRAENELKKRQKVWHEQTADKLRANAAGIESPDPGPEPKLDEIIAEHERARLFKIIEELIQWENTHDQGVLEKAQAEIWQSWRRTCAENAGDLSARDLFDRNRLPNFCDPFAGSGGIPLSAQWLGLESFASDLNPVAVVINKATIEFPSRFTGLPPVNPKWRERTQSEKALRIWKGSAGLADDVRYYAAIIRDEVEKQIGHLYPKIEITEELASERSDLLPYVGTSLTVNAWLWARTVKSPNPAFRNSDVPLVSTFMLSSKAGKEVYIRPVIKGDSFSLAIKKEKPHDPEITRGGTSMGKRKAFKCLLSGVPIGYDYIRGEAKAGRMGEMLMVTVAEGARGRVFLPATEQMVQAASDANPTWRPDCELPKKHRNFQPPVYGMDNLGDIFTPRQLVSLTAFSDAIPLIRERIYKDAAESLLTESPAGRNGVKPEEYADAMCIYLACVIDRMAYYGSSLTSWLPKDNALRDCMPRQALAMTWDFAECNPFGKSSGDINTCINSIANYLEIATPFSNGIAYQADAQSIQTKGARFIFSTDPPYFDNISYADLSDFFYVWLRRTLKGIWPGLFSTLSVPKADELIAAPARHGGEENAEKFFLGGMTAAMNRMIELGHPSFPITIYYAFKQSETDEEDGTTNTGWDTFLGAVIDAGLSITGTWPMRTEGAGRMIASGTNALASSIVLVCRKRSENAATVTRREFVNALKSDLPEALRHLQRGNIAPVDLAQAAIGPGMAVFTRYEKVLDAKGKPLSVRDALALINQTLDEVLAEQDGDFDADTRWALVWFDQFGFDEGIYGTAEQLSKAKNTSVDEMADPRTSPIIQSKNGKVRLFRPDELQEDWTPEGDGRLTVWDMVHQLVRVLEKDGESAAARIAAQLGAKAETARELCYRLYTLCERKKRAAEALSYNGLVQSWPEIMRLAQEESTSTGGTAQSFEFSE